VLVELGAERHGVDRHRLAVVVENDDLKEPAVPVGPT
jgi:hypothetical protein